MNIIKINDTSNKLFYIGGVVRDEILGQEPLDTDIVYTGRDIEYCAKFGKVIKENPKFGTIRVEINGNEIDFASARQEIYEKKGHLPVITNLGCSLKDDVLRRDFTVNALAKSVTTGEIIDYTGGLDDLKHKKLRVLHDKSFIDDPTRIIRGLKFSVRLGFELEEHTKQLQKDYLDNINYDMSYKRLKKELVETFNLNSQKAFDEFIDEKIYKLVTEKEVISPNINIENLVNKYSPENVWLIYMGVLKDLSRLPLTAKEQKILNDIPQKILKTDFELYKAFENASVETVILYGILKDTAGACRYLDNLRSIRIAINGNDLQKIGIPPSDKYSQIFDEVLKLKLQNPNITKTEEIDFVKKYTDI